MVTKAQKFRLGIFLVVGSVLIIVFFILIAGKKIMEKRDIYYIKYEDRSVTGLQVGGAVKYHGIGIGRIDDISIDQEDVSNVIVTISIKDETPIKSNVKATLVPVGITGLLQIELVGGTNEARTLEPFSYINPGASMFESITGKAEVIAEKLEILLNNFAEMTNETNREKVSNILHNVDTVVERNATTVDTIMLKFAQTSAELEEISASINSTLQSGKLQKVIDNLDKTTTELSQVDMTELLKNTNEAIIEFNDTIEEIGTTHLRGRQNLLDTIELLEETIEYLNEFSRRISEDPSLLWRSKNQ